VESCYRIDRADAETEATAFMRRDDITCPNGPDLGARISQSFRLRGVPETYIIGSSGQLALVQVGPPNRSTLMRVIYPLLK